MCRRITYTFYGNFEVNIGYLKKENKMFCPVLCVWLIWKSLLKNSKKFCFWKWTVRNIQLYPNELRYPLYWTRGLWLCLTFAKQVETFVKNTKRKPEWTYDSMLLTSVSFTILENPHNQSWIFDFEPCILSVFGLLLASKSRLSVFKLFLLKIQF